MCPATLEFYDDTGALLKQLAVTNISPATAASLVFKPPVPSTTAGARAQIRAVVLTPLNFVFNPGASSPTPTMLGISACNVMASLEIIDDPTGDHPHRSPPTCERCLFSGQFPLFSRCASSYTHWMVVSIPFAGIGARDGNTRVAYWMEGVDMSQLASPKGSARGAARPSEPTVGPWLAFGLNEQIEQLQKEPYWQSGRNSKTIVHYSDFRMVVTAMQANTTIHEHRTAGRLAVQILHGHVRMHADGKEFDLPAGRMLVVDQAVPYDLTRSRTVRLLLADCVAGRRPLIVPDLFTRLITEASMWFRKLMHTADDHTLMALRIILGVVFCAHGAQKVLGWFGGAGFDQTFKHSRRS